MRAFKRVKATVFERWTNRQEMNREAINDCRQRITTEEAEAKLKQCKRIALINTNAKAAGFARQLRRGLAKVQAMAVLVALGHNLRTTNELTRLPKAQSA